MIVEIKITGPAACGKSHLAGYLRDAVARIGRETGQSITVKITEAWAPSSVGPNPHLPSRIAAAFKPDKRN